MNMPTRRQLVSSLVSRVARFTKNGDQAGLTDPIALREAFLLMSLIDMDQADLDSEAVSAIALLHWHRSVLLPAGSNAPDLQSALWLFSRLYDVDASLVPEPPRSLIRRSKQAAVAAELQRKCEAAIALVSEAERVADVALLDAAIGDLRAALSGFPDQSSPIIVLWQLNLGAALRVGYRIGHREADLSAGISTIRDALSRSDVLPPAVVAMNMHLLSEMLYDRYLLLRESADLDEGIAAASTAIRTAGQDEDLARYWNFLGLMLHVKAERGSAIADLDDAITASSKAIEYETADPDARARHRTNLSNSLRMRFEWLGQIPDLDRAVTYARSAVDLEPEENTLRALCLSNLGVILRIQFEQRARHRDLQDAVQAARRSALVCETGDPERPVILTNLGNALRLRYDVYGELADLDEAAKALAEAAELTNDYDEAQAGRLSNLSVALLSLAERTGELEYLDASVANSREASRLAIGRSYEGGVVSNLGIALQMRYQLTRDIDDLDAAIEAARLSAGNPLRPQPLKAVDLAHLCVGLRLRFEKLGQVSDLYAALDAGREAEALSEPGHPWEARTLSSIAAAFQARYELEGREEDAEAAIERWRRAAASPAGYAWTRLNAAVAWGEAAAQADRHCLAMDGYRTAMEVLPALASHGLERRSQENHLGRLAGLASDGAACAAGCSQPDVAVQILEGGRSVLWRNMLDLRGDMAVLRDTDPELYSRLDEIRALLDRRTWDLYS